MEIEIEKEIREKAIDGLKDGIGQDNPIADLHHYLFNEDYFIIGNYMAEEWLKVNPGIFNAIHFIQEYELDNFGEVTTNISQAENVANMYAYIQGENLLQESKTIMDNWDEDLTEDLAKQIIEELKEGE